MRARTKEEVENKLRELYSDSDDLKIEVTIRPEAVHMTISSMYSAPGLSFFILSELSKFFETSYINDEDDFSYRGCDSCDYGSKVGYILVARPDKKGDTIEC